MTTEEMRNHLNEQARRIAKERRAERRSFGFALAFIGFATMLFFSVFLGLLLILVGGILFLANLD